MSVFDGSRFMPATRDNLSTPMATKSEACHRGLLIVNADDWGRDQNTTDRTLECVVCGSVSSVSAMVFMEDSERAAAIAQERRIDTGLHLNLTTPFSAPRTPPLLVEHQQRVSQYLRQNSFAQAVFHPGLTRSFEYVVAGQRDEFLRLYTTVPDRLDGHHHMHLCSNVVFGGLLTSGTRVRRNFSFRPGEKSLWNRLYRRVVDHVLSRSHHLTDYFFSLPPLEPSSRLAAIFSLARECTVELETHPVNPDEHRFLAGGDIFRWFGDDLRIAPRFVSRHERPRWS
jgi:chitin disaccharide deacetylase